MIRIDQPLHSTTPTGTPGESRSDLEPGKQVELHWTGTAGVYLWTVEISAGSSISASATTSNPALVDGLTAGHSFNAFLDLDGAEESYTTEYGGRSSTQGGGACVNAQGNWLPAQGERKQFSGWGARIGAALTSIGDLDTAVDALEVTAPSADQKTSLAQLDGADQGTVFYAAASGRVARLAPGTSGQVLSSGGAAADPTWEDPSGGGGVSDHGALTGLADDDHTQYALADGTRNFTGKIQSPGHEFVQQSANPGGTPANTLYQDDGTNYDAGSFVVPNKAVVADEVSVGEPGTEQGAVDIQGVAFDAILKVNDFGGSRKAILVLHRHSTIDDPTVLFSRSKSNDASHAAVEDNDIVGVLLFAGHDGTDYNRAAEIRAAIDGAVGANDMPGRLLFLTSQDGSNVPTEALRLDSGQNATFAGNIIVSGTVDGRDLATDGTKLDGVEVGADVTDAANVEAAGAVMDSDFAGSTTGSLERTGVATYGVKVHKFDATTAPGSSNDSTEGYSVGSRWIDVTAGNTYECIDASVGSASWEQTNAGGGGSGDVVGPAGATDNALARFDTATGKLLQDGSTTEDDSGNLVTAGSVTLGGNLLFSAEYDVGSQSIRAGRIFSGRSQMHSIVKKTTSYSINKITDYAVLFEIASTQTATLGSVDANYDGIVHNIINSSSSSAALTVSGGIKSLDSAVPTSLAAGESCVVQYYDADDTWHLISKG